MQIESVLINEAQLGTALNSSLTQRRRNDFALLLASLSYDALDFAQFQLPKTRNQSPVVGEQQLRRELGAAKHRPCAPPHYDVVLTQGQRQTLALSSLTSLRLQDCLAPTPLAIRDDATHIPLPVITNCAPNVQAKHGQQSMSLSEAQMDAAAFYDQLSEIKAQKLFASA
ncbi:VC2046/SO_2500 family protein [Pseudoalteromonas sp. BDTF-M6]|uniref:VC2046/SO_2500 family protein n=1 Tax=Pseudoalteromonas sp. BDTF-M6 TaxID=2796132 RepID=UPI001BB06088|nr:VC2046/SO_2500 family protein [Pseudoalteromonas sp. BDTF-M6]MBS3796432.1 queD like 2 [Pseudoalteromonas sp. BDTF-M6]